MKIYTYIILLLFLVGQTISVMVTKEMKFPRVYDLSSLNQAGKQHVRMNGKRDVSTLPSVILIPGLGGSQLKAKLNKTSSEHWYCSKHSDDYLIWLQLTQLLPGLPEKCWQENIKLTYDADTVSFTNSSGVEISSFDWGSPSSFEYVDPDAKRETVYFAPLVSSLLELGYIRSVNLFGAPYDWRLSPNYAHQFFHQFKELAEQAYSVNNLPVVVVAHSMGNMYFKHFLEKMTQAWKDKHIKGFAAIAPPWVGAIAAVDTIVSGNDFTIPYLAPLAARVVQRSFPASYFVLPNPKYYNDVILVSTPVRNYSALDYASLFTDISVPDGINIWNKVNKAMDPYIPPGVPTSVYYGKGIPTHIGATFKSTDFNSRSEIKFGDGDGTVPFESLTFGEIWANKSSHSYNERAYPGQTHVGMLAYQPLILDILVDFI
eukprot:TRINITY_DN1849_c0_g1_i1.p1 TRINITY_DN1849_c0_g1~~TRINITY_DN1849_c0_g1_i1.p1  ORF type:complete len:430 (-),score=115.87 TRINITY_DN1849_c0_g1_i1:28-1317(-)